MKSPRITLARLRLGRPAPGGVKLHPKGSFTFEQGAEATERLSAVFGELSELACIDLGCGAGETVIAKQILNVPWRRLQSVDAFEPYLNKLRQQSARARQHAITELRVEQVFEHFGPGEFDVAILIDVLEHFTRREAIALLVRLERFAGRGVAVFSPVGRVEQDDLDGNAFQCHRSFWLPEDWARLGYDVEVYEAFHGHLDPPATAAWAIKRWG